MDSHIVQIIRDVRPIQYCPTNRLFAYRCEPQVDKATRSICLIARIGVDEESPNGCLDAAYTISMTSRISGCFP